jgi:site-specific DNA recombinase
MRAFGYVRLSKDTEGTTSPARQREAIERLCADRGWELLEI